MITLARFLAPLTLGRASVHVPGARDRFADLPGVASLPALIAAGAEKQLDRIRGGIGQPLASAGDPQATLRALERERSSLRIRRVQVIDEPVRRLALALLAELDEEINVNAYYSPVAEAAALAPHTDPYDVLVLQLEGEKLWRLFDGDAAGELRVASGDVLYLPAGLRHAARTERASLHLTIGIHRKTGRSLVEWLARELGADVALAQPAADGWPALERALQALLADPERAQRFADYRRAIEYERTLATPDEHARGEARGYR